MQVLANTSLVPNKEYARGRTSGKSTAYGSAGGVQMSLWLRHRPYELRPIFISAANFPSRGFRKNLQALHSQKCLIRNVQVRAAVESPPRDKGG
jgi:hypothetical protein